MDASHYFPRRLSGRADVLPEYSLIRAWTSCKRAERCAACLCKSRIFSSLLLLWLISEINTETRKGKGARCPGKWEAWIAESEGGRVSVACGERKSEFVRRGFYEQGRQWSPPQHSAVSQDQPHRKATTNAVSRWD